MIRSRKSRLKVFSPLISFHFVADLNAGILYSASLCSAVDTYMGAGLPGFSSLFPQCCPQRLPFFSSPHTTFLSLLPLHSLMMMCPPRVVYGGKS